MAENAVFWKQGLFLHPQHFQLMSRQIHGAIEPVLRLASPNAWGASHLRIRESALENGILDIVGGDFLFPDGTHVRLPANAVLPSRKMPDSGSEDDDANGGGLLTAHVALRRWNDRGRNVSLRETTDRGAGRVETMYVSDLVPQTIPDLYSDGPEAQILTVRYALEIVWESEIEQYGDCHLLPVARMRKVGDRLQIEKKLYSPSPSIGAHPDLLNRVRNIRDGLLGRCKRLENTNRPRTCPCQVLQSGDRRRIAGDAVAKRLRGVFRPSLRRARRAPLGRLWSCSPACRRVEFVFCGYCRAVPETGGGNLVTALRS